MNVFEDLVLELKEENLLENTFVDFEDGIDITDEPNPVEEDAVPAVDDFEIVSGLDQEAATDEPPIDKPKTSKRAAAAKKAKHGREFFNKRAVAEVSSLQMVEHVLTGVEREYLKIVPKPFDDFNAKKALNAFLQVSEDSNSKEHKQAEFDLMQET